MATDYLSARNKRGAIRSLTKFPWLFLILAYGLSWLMWIPVALTRQDYQSSPLLLIIIFLGIFGPGMAGILLTYLQGIETNGEISGCVCWI